MTLSYLNNAVGVSAVKTLIATALSSSIGIALKRT